MQRFFGEAIALEVYHAPQWFLRVIRVASRGMGTHHLMAEAPLQAAAEKRAAKLREQMLLVDADAGDGTISGKASPATSSIEDRARRHLRIVASS